MELLLDNINRGLKKETHDQATVKCFVTYVQDLPKGTEQGKYLALDLGGTNFRVLLVELKGQDHCEMKSEIYATPQSIMEGPGEDVSNFCVFPPKHCDVRPCSTFYNIAEGLTTFNF